MMIFLKIISERTLLISIEDYLAGKEVVRFRNEQFFR